MLKNSTQHFYEMSRFILFSLSFSEILDNCHILIILDYLSLWHMNFVKHRRLVNKSYWKKNLYFSFYTSITMTISGVENMNINIDNFEEKK